MATADTFGGGGDRTRPVRLLRGQELYYIPEIQADHGRFVRLFRETWRRVPPAERRILVGEWRAARWPSVRCVHYRSNAFDGGTLSNWTPGAGFVFYADVFENAPDVVMMTIIAEEFARVVRRIYHRKERPDLFERASLQYIPSIESTVNDPDDPFWAGEFLYRFEMRASWGFEEEPYYVWCVETGQGLLAARWS